MAVGGGFGYAVGVMGFGFWVADEAELLIRWRWLIALVAVGDWDAICVSCLLGSRR